MHPEEPLIVYAVEGEPVILVAPVTDGEDFQWSRTDGAVDSRWASSSDGVRATLTTESATLADSGEYVLHASGGPRKRMRLEVRGRTPADADSSSPFFLRRLTDLAVKVGSRTRLIVEIQSDSEVQVTWYRNSRRLQPSSAVNMTNEGRFHCLELNAAAPEDSGRWTCAAANKMGRAECSAHVNVIVPKAYKRPEFLEELRAILTDQGTVSLECKVVGVPTPTLRWFKDSEEIRAGDVFALTANPEDATSLGIYTCEASNCMGKTYSSSKVHVVGRGSREGSLKPADSVISSEPAPIFLSELQEQRVKIGEPLELSCRVGIPPWPKSVIWYNKNGRADPTECIAQEDGVGGLKLSIQSVTWDHEGEWKCVAASAGGRLSVSTCYVNVDVPKNYRKPRFMENLKAVLTEEGLVSFECKVVGFPTPQLSWFKDGLELKPGDVYQLTGSNSLGSYCCIAKNCMGQASSQAELTVEDIQNQLDDEERMQLFSENKAPKFVQVLKSQEAKINEDFRFSVKVSISPEPTLTWYRDDQPIDESPRYKITKESKGVYHLDIRQLEITDQAEWKCIATNEFGHSVTSCFLKLVIPRHFKKPRFLENLRAILSEEGAVNLECKVIGVPQPVLKWYKDGEELKAGDIHRIISGQDGTCCLGTYTCEAQNCMGIAASSASLLGFEDTMRAGKTQQKVDQEPLQRNVSLSTIHEERTSQLYDTPVGDITLDEKGEISFSFSGKEVSVSLYETPDLTEEEALQIVEMYADQLSENITEQNVVELPPLRFVKETSTSGNLLMEAIVIDVSPDYFISAEEDLRTEADMEDISIIEEVGVPTFPVEITEVPVLHHPVEEYPERPPRKKSESIKSGDDYHSFSKEKSDSEKRKIAELQSESDQQSYGTAESMEISKSNHVKKETSKERSKTPDDKTPKSKKRRKERKESIGSRRSSSGSEKSLDSDFMISLTPKVLEDIVKKLIAIQKVSKVVQTQLGAIEDEVILQSAQMSSAATAKKSLEVIESLKSPLTDIQKISNVIKEDSIHSENVISTFQKYILPLKMMHQNLAVIEKCIEIEGGGKTLVQRTSVCLIETLAKPMQSIFKSLKDICRTIQSHHSSKNMKEIHLILDDTINSLVLSEESIRSASLIKEASEIPHQNVHEEQNVTENENVIQNIWKPILKLQKSLESVKHNICIEQDVNMQEYVMDLISRPIQELQKALETIEEGAVKESNEKLYDINSVILQRIVDPMLTLRNDLDSLKNEMTPAVVENTLENLTNSIQNIKSSLISIGEQFDIKDIEPFEENQRMIQSVARNLLVLQTNVENLSKHDKVAVLTDKFDKLQMNLAQLLESALHVTPFEGINILKNIQGPTQNLNTSFEFLNTNDIENFVSAATSSIDDLKESIGNVKSLQNSDVNDCLQSSIISIKDLKAFINQQPLIHPEEMETDLSAEVKQNIASLNDISEKIKNHILLATETQIPSESLKDFGNLENITQLTKLANILIEIRDQIAANETKTQDPVDTPQSLSQMSINKELAQPLNELNYSLNVASQQLLDDYDSMHSSMHDISALKLLIKPLQDFHDNLTVIQHNIQSVIGESIGKFVAESSIAKSLRDLDSCLLDIQEQYVMEVADDISTLQDISGIKSVAEIKHLSEIVPLKTINIPLENAELFSELYEGTPKLAIKYLYHCLLKLEEAIQIDDVGKITYPPLKSFMECTQKVKNNLQVCECKESEANNYAAFQEVLTSLTTLQKTLDDIINDKSNEVLSEGSMDEDSFKKLNIITESFLELQQNIALVNNSITISYNKENAVENLSSQRGNFAVKTEPMPFETVEDISTAADISVLKSLAAPLQELKYAVGAIQQQARIWETSDQIADQNMPAPDNTLVISLQEALNGIATIENVLTGEFVKSISDNIITDDVKQIALPLKELTDKIIAIKENLISHQQDIEKSISDFTYDSTIAEALVTMEKCFAVLEQHDLLDVTQVSDICSQTDKQQFAEVNIERELSSKNNVLENTLQVFTDIQSISNISESVFNVEERLNGMKNGIKAVQKMLKEPLAQIIKNRNEIKSLVNTSETDLNSLEVDILTSKLNNGDKDSVVKYVESLRNNLLKINKMLTSIFNFNKQRELINPLKRIKQFSNAVASIPISLCRQLPILETIITPLQDICHQFELADLNSTTSQHVDVQVHTESIIDPVKTMIQSLNAFSSDTNDESNLLVVQNLKTCQDVLDSFVSEYQSGDKIVKSSFLNEISVSLNEITNIILNASEAVVTEHDTLKSALSCLAEPIKVVQDCLSTLQKHFTSPSDDDTLTADISLNESYAEPVFDMQKEIVNFEECVMLSEEIPSEMKLAQFDQFEKSLHSFQDNIIALEQTCITNEDKICIDLLKSSISEIEDKMHQLEQKYATGQTVDEINDNLNEFFKINERSLQNCKACVKPFNELSSALSTIQDSKEYNLSEIDCLSIAIESARQTIEKIVCDININMIQPLSNSLITNTETIMNEVKELAESLEIVTKNINEIKMKIPSNDIVTTSNVVVMQHAVQNIINSLDLSSEQCSQFVDKYVSNSDLKDNFALKCNEIIHRNSCDIIKRNIRDLVISSPKILQAVAEPLKSLEMLISVLEPDKYCKVSISENFSGDISQSSFILTDIVENGNTSEANLDDISSLIMKIIQNATIVQNINTICDRETSKDFGLEISDENKISLGQTLKVLNELITTNPNIKFIDGKEVQDLVKDIFELKDETLVNDTTKLKLQNIRVHIDEIQDRTFVCKEEKIPDLMESLSDALELIDTTPLNVACANVTVANDEIKEWIIKLITKIESPRDDHDHILKNEASMSIEKELLLMQKSEINLKLSEILSLKQPLMELKSILVDQAEVCNISCISDSQQPEIVIEDVILQEPSTLGQLIHSVKSMIEESTESTETFETSELMKIDELYENLSKAKEAVVSESTQNFSKADVLQLISLIEKLETLEEQTNFKSSENRMNESLEEMGFNEEIECHNDSLDEVIATIIEMSKTQETNQSFEKISCKKIDEIKNCFLQAKKLFDKPLAEIVSKRREITKCIDEANKLIDDFENVELVKPTEDDKIKESLSSSICVIKNSLCRMQATVNKLNSYCRQSNFLTPIKEIKKFTNLSKNFKEQEDAIQFRHIFSMDEPFNKICNTFIQFDKSKQRSTMSDDIEVPIKDVKDKLENINKMISLYQDENEGSHVLNKPLTELTDIITVILKDGEKNNIDCHSLKSLSIPITKLTNQLTDLLKKSSKESKPFITEGNEKLNDENRDEIVKKDVIGTETSVKIFGNEKVQQPEEISKTHDNITQQSDQCEIIETITEVAQELISERNDENTGFLQMETIEERAQLTELKDNKNIEIKTADDEPKEKIDEKQILIDDLVIEKTVLENQEKALDDEEKTAQEIQQKKEQFNALNTTEPLTDETELAKKEKKDLHEINLEVTNINSLETEQMRMEEIEEKTVEAQENADDERNRNKANETPMNDDDSEQKKKMEFDTKMKEELEQPQIDDVKVNKKQEDPKQQKEMEATKKIVEEQKKDEEIELKKKVDEEQKIKEELDVKKKSEEKKLKDEANKMIEEEQKQKNDWESKETTEKEQELNDDNMEKVVKQQISIEKMEENKVINEIKELGDNNKAKPDQKIEDSNKKAEDEQEIREKVEAIKTFDGNKGQGLMDEAMKKADEEQKSKEALEAEMKAEEEQRLKDEAKKKADEEQKEKEEFETTKKAEEEQSLQDEAEKRTEKEGKKKEELDAKEKTGEDQRLKDEAKKKAGEEQKEREESEAKTKAEEEQKQKQEMEAKKMSEEEERLKDEAKKKADEEQKKKDELEAKKIAEEEQGLKDEAKKKADEEQRMKEELEDKRKAEEKQKQKDELEAKKKADEEQKLKDDAKKRADEEQRMKEELEDKRKAEEKQKQKDELEAKKKADEEQKLKDDAKKRADEEQRMKEELEAKIKAEEQPKQKDELEAKKKADEEQRLKDDAKKRADEEQKKKEELEAKEKSEEEKRPKDEAKKKADEEQKQKDELEAKKIAEEEQGLKDEAKKKADEEQRMKKELEAKREAEEEQKKKEELEIKKKAEDEERLKDEAKKKADEEKKKKQELEAKRKAEKEQRLNGEANKKADEEQMKKEELGAKIKAEEEQKKKDELEAMNIDEEEKRLKDEAKKMADEEQNMKEEFEAMRKTKEEQKKKEELEAKKKADEEQKMKEELEAKRKIEEEQKKKDELEAKRKADEEQKMKEELEAKRKVEEEQKKKEELEAKRKTGEEQKKEELEVKKKADEEQKMKEELEAKRKVEEEQKKKEELEAKRKANEEQKKKEELEATKKAEEEQRLKDEAKKKADEEQKMKEELEAKRNAEEEQKKKEESEAKRKADEEQRIKEELEAKRKANEEQKKKEELEAIKKTEEEHRLKNEAKKKADEEQKKKEELEAEKKAEEEQRLKDEAKKKADEEQKRKEELEAKKKVEEEQRFKDEAKKKADEEQKKKEELEAKKKAEEEQRLKDEAKRIADEEEKKKEELEAKKKAEEEQKLKNEAKKKADEEQKKKEELETKRKAEEEQRLKDEAKKKADEEQNKKEELEAKMKTEEEQRLKDEAKKKADEEQKKKEELEAEKKAEEEQRLKDEAKKKADEEQKKKEELEAKKKAEEEQRLKDEAKRKADEEQKKKEELEAKKKAEEDQRLKDEAKKKADEEQKKKEELEAMKKAEEEQRLKDEAKKKADEEQKKKEELEAKKKAEEEQRLKDEAKKKADEEQKKKEELEAKKKAEEEQRLKDEAKKKADEDQKKKEELEAKKKAEEEQRLKDEAKKKADEEQKKKEELEAKKKAEEDQRLKDEVKKKADEEQKKKEELEAKKKAEEEQRLKNEAKKKADEEQKKKEELEAKKKAEEEQRLKDKAKKKADEEQKKKEELEAKKKAEEDQRLKDEVKKKADEEQKKKEELEAKKKAEEEQRLKNEAKKKADEEQKKKEELEAKKKAEEEQRLKNEAKKKADEEQKKKEELEAKKKAEEDQRLKDEAKKKADEEQKKKEELDAMKKAEEEQRLKNEAKKKADEEQKKKEELEAKKKAEEDQRLKDEAKKKADEEQKKKEELEAMKKAEEEQRLKDEAKKKADEEQKKKEELEAKKKAEEEQRLKNEAKKKADEEQKKKEELESKKKVEKEQRLKDEAKKNADEKQKMKKADEEQKKKEELEAKNKAEEEQRLKDEANKKADEEQKKKKDLEAKKKTEKDTKVQAHRDERSIEHEVKQKYMTEVFESETNEEGSLKSVDSKKSSDKTLSEPSDPGKNLEIKVLPEESLTRSLDVVDQKNNYRHSATRISGDLKKFDVSYKKAERSVKSISEAPSSPLSRQKTPGPRDVKKKPIFSTRLTDRTAVEGSRVKLTCSVLGSPEPGVQWFRNGVLLMDKNKYLTKFCDGLATLEILNVELKDTADYTCTAINENGTTSCAASLKVYAGVETTPIPPTFTRSIRDTYHVAEDEMVLECRIRGQPRPVITWMKDGKPLTPEIRYQMNYLADGECRLVINRPQPSDSGKYTCRAQNPLWSDEITHHVQFAGRDLHLAASPHRYETVRSVRSGHESRRPYFSRVLSDYSVPLGGTIALQVEVGGGSAEVEWRRGGAPLSIGPRVKEYVDRGVHTLAVENVSVEESGVYTCTVKNEHGCVDTTAMVSVLPTGILRSGKAATLVSRPEVDISVTEGEDFTISLRAQGDPKPKVIWMKGLRDITHSWRSFKENSDDYFRFTLKRTLMSDAGTYCILAKNCYGCDRTFVTLFVRQRLDSNYFESDKSEYSYSDVSNIRDVPQAIVGEPEVSDAGKDWVSLRWSKPPKGPQAPVLAYRVDAWLQGVEGGARWQSLGLTPVNGFDAFKLTPGAYLFRVTPRNRYGWGPSIQTKEPIAVGGTLRLPEFTTPLPGQIKVLLGDSITLSCTVVGSPMPTVAWYKDGQDVDGTVMSSSGRCVLHIAKVDQNHEGRYTCEASGPEGRAATFARLSVVSDKKIFEADENFKKYMESDTIECAPVFSMRLRDRRVQTTYPVRLTCRVEGRPSPIVTWTKDEEIIDQNDHYSFWASERFYTLEINNTNLDDAGKYSAHAANPLGAVRCSAILTVDKGLRAYLEPDFVLAPDTLYRVKEGSELRIRAVVEAYPSVGVSWHRDGLRLRPSRRTLFTLDRDGEIEMALAHVTRRDSGIYTVTASNEVGKATCSTRVEVIAPGDEGQYADDSPLLFTPATPYSKEPIFIKKPRSSEAKEGDTVVILCEVAGDPKPEVLWLRDWLKPEYYRDATQFRRVGAGPEYRLEIPHCKLDHTGAYTVIASNCHGQAKAIISLQIYAKGPDEMDHRTVTTGRVHVLPKIIRDLKDMRCCDGDAVTFECLVQGTPSPLVQWEKDGQIIHEAEDFKMEMDGEVAHLTITCVYPEDEGVYTCTAYNELGKVYTSSCLIVDVPEEKENLLSQQLTRPPMLLSAGSTPRSTPRSTPCRSMSPQPHHRVIRQRDSMSQTPSRTSRWKLAPPKFFAVPFNRVAEEGENVSFRCSIAGHPVPKVYWDKDGSEIQLNPRISIREKDDDRVLTINSVKYEDSGVYRVTLENEAGRVEATACLDVINLKGTSPLTRVSASPRTSPYVRRHLNGSHYRVGERLRLSSEMRGSPSVSSKWYRNGQLLQMNDRVFEVKEQDTFTLIIDSLKTSDTGIYTLVVSNELGCASTWTNIKVENKIMNSDLKCIGEHQPHIINVLEDITVEEGKATEIQLKIENCCVFSFTWIRNNTILPDSDIYKYVDYGNGVIGLRFEDIYMQDDGVYTCIIRNAFGSAKSTCNITVKESATGIAFNGFKNYPKPVMVELNGDALFHLSIDPKANMNNPKAVWQVSGKEITESTPKYKLSKDGCKFTLKISRVDGNDSGYIRCAVRIPLNSNDEPGKISESLWFTTQLCVVPAAYINERIQNDMSDGNMLIKPRFTSKIENCIIPLGGKALFSAKFFGCPSPKITWFLLDREISPCKRFNINNTPSSTTLEINDVELGDSAVYKVIIDNGQGADSVTALLQVEDTEISQPPASLYHKDDGMLFDSQYSIHNVIGRGHFGSVKLIKNKKSGEQLAAKFVKITKQKDKEVIMSELEILHCLKHPKLIQLVDAFMKPNQMIIITEYISGGQLFERVSEDDFTLTERDCILFMAQILEGVAFMHSKNIVHLDLKPENIMCHTRPSHEIKIIDFGLARRLRPNEEIRTLCGTAEFIAPEVVNFDPISTASDMWSIGVICYILLSGLSPFAGDTVQETYSNILRVKYDFDDESFDKISEDAKDFIRELLVKQMDKRPTAAKCLQNKWMMQHQISGSSTALSTEKLRKFVVQSKWQMTGNAIRAVGRMASLCAISKMNTSRLANKTDNPKSPIVEENENAKIDSLPDTRTKSIV